MNSKKKRRPYLILKNWPVLIFKIVRPKNWTCFCLCLSRGSELNLEKVLRPTWHRRWMTTSDPQDWWCGPSEYFVEVADQQGRWRTWTGMTMEVCKYAERIILKSTRVDRSYEDTIKKKKILTCLILTKPLKSIAEQVSHEGPHSAWKNS